MSTKLTLNGEPIESWLFPAGEVGVKLNPKHINTYSSKIPQDVTSYIKSSDDLMKTFMLLDALKRGGYRISLNIPYIPYGRQDRVCHKGEAFSLKVFAEMLNSFGVEQIITYDAHSLVTPALINNLTVIFKKDLMLKHILQQYTRLVSPDAGALKSVQELGESVDMDVTTATKTRSNKGTITTTTLNDNVEDEDCLIVDDICDGGATFIALAEALKKAGAGSVGLYVTHGLFTKGVQHLLDNGIDDVYSVFNYHNYV